MTRRKVKLAFISNEASRKATFEKRKKGFLKKVSELASLCGIKACAVLYSPYDSGPVVWPSDAGVQSVVAEFRALPTMDQVQNMVDQAAFLCQRIAKKTDYLRKSRKENRELEMTQVMFQCILENIERFHMSIMDLNDLDFLTDQYLKDVNRRIELLHNAGMEIGESSNAGMEIGGSSSAAAIGPGGSGTMATMAGESEQMRYRSEQMEYPFMDDSSRNIYQQLPGESSVGPAIVSSSGNTSSVDPAIASSSGNRPITDPSLPNNLWFR